MKIYIGVGKEPHVARHHVWPRVGVIQQRAELTVPPLRPQQPEDRLHNLHFLRPAFFRELRENELLGALPQHRLPRLYRAQRGIAARNDARRVLFRHIVQRRADGLLQQRELLFQRAAARSIAERFGGGCVAEQLVELFSQLCPGFVAVTGGGPPTVSIQSADKSVIVVIKKEQCNRVGALRQTAGGLFQPQREIALFLLRRHKGQPRQIPVAEQIARRKRRFESGALRTVQTQCCKRHSHSGLLIQFL